MLVFSSADGLLDAWKELQSFDVIFHRGSRYRASNLSSVAAPIFMPPCSFMMVFHVELAGGGYLQRPGSWTTLPIVIWVEGRNRSITGIHKSLKVGEWWSTITITHRIIPYHEHQACPLPTIPCWWTILPLTHYLTHHDSGLRMMFCRSLRKSRLHECGSIRSRTRL